MSITNIVQRHDSGGTLVIHNLLDRRCSLALSPRKSRIANNFLTCPDIHFMVQMV